MGCRPTRGLESSIALRLVLVVFLMAVPVVVGIDQSYTKLGLAAVTRAAVLTAETVDLSKLNKTQARLATRELVRHYIAKWKPRFIVVERVRLFVGAYISQATAKQLAAMTACIVDAAYCNQEEHELRPIKVFSCDTRSWKKGILGAGNADKEAAFQWLLSRIPPTMQGMLDHNAADAACMARYAFLPDAKLTRER